MSIARAAAVGGFPRAVMVVPEDLGYRPPAHEVVADAGARLLDVLPTPLEELHRRDRARHGCSAR